MVQQLRICLPMQGTQVLCPPPPQPRIVQVLFDFLLGNQGDIVGQPLDLMVSISLWKQGLTVFF